MYTLVNVNYIPLTGSRTHTCRNVSKIHDISIEYNGIKTQWWTPFRVVLYNFRNLIAICNMFYIYVCISNTSFKINSKLCYTPCIMSIRLSTSSKFDSLYSMDFSNYAYYHLIYLLHNAIKYVATSGYSLISSTNSNQLC